jgi:tRNA dimethylallyltransferase
MLQQGALTEAQHIQQAMQTGALSPNLPSLKAVGLPPLLAYLDGQLNLQQATELAQTQTRQYAKRQYTWLRHQTLEIPNRLTVKLLKRSNKLFKLLGVV